MSVGYEYDGAVMITASHLPFNRNGFKFFTRDGGFEKADIGQLLKLAAEEHASVEAPNLAPGAAYEDDAFVLSCALHASPALIEYVRLSFSGKVQGTLHPKTPPWHPRQHTRTTRLCCPAHCTLARH